MCNYTSNTICSGTRKLLGKQTIYSMHVHDDLLFAGGSSVDATTGKVCNSQCFSLFTNPKLKSLSIGSCSILVPLLCWPFFCIWKVLSLPTKKVLGSFLTGLDIHRIAVNNDYIFTATKCGIIEVWLKESVAKVASIKMAGGGHSKITSLTSNMDDFMLFAGSSDGKIHVSDELRK